MIDVFKDDRIKIAGDTPEAKRQGWLDHAITLLTQYVNESPVEPGKAYNVVIVVDRGSMPEGVPEVSVISNAPKKAQVDTLILGAKGIMDQMREKGEI